MSTKTKSSDIGAAQESSPMPSKLERPAKPKKLKTGKAKAAGGFSMVKADRKARLIAKNARLEQLAGEIRSSRESIGALSKTAREKMEETMVEVAHCGKLLSECKTLVAHGDWLKWLNDNCKMSVSTAQHYMRVAALTLSNKERALYLEQPKSIRQAIALLTNGRQSAALNRTKPNAAGETRDIVMERIATLARRMAQALESLPQEKRQTAFDTLTAIRDWLNSASIPE
jgi:DUF3102 family protein